MQQHIVAVDTFFLSLLTENVCFQHQNILW